MSKTPKSTFSLQNTYFRVKFFFYQNLDFVLGGANDNIGDAIRKLLDDDFVTHQNIEPHIVEMPMIVFREDGMGLIQLDIALRRRKSSRAAFIITSPQAAKVFMQALKIAGATDDMLFDITTSGNPTADVISIGYGTTVALQEQHSLIYGDVDPRSQVVLNVLYTSPISTSKNLAEEIPLDLLEGRTVYYPASKKASNNVVTILKRRGVEVKRINVYDTIGGEDRIRFATPAIYAHQELYLQGFKRQLLPAPEKRDGNVVLVVTFGSESAVKSWKHVDLPIADPNVWAACVGRG